MCDSIMGSLRSVSQKLMRLDLQVKKENECHRMSSSDTKNVDNYIKAQCLSPRPRPRALPIGADSGLDRADSPFRKSARQPKPLLYISDPTAGLPTSRNRDNKTSLQDHLERNGTIQLAGLVGITRINA